MWWTAALLSVLCAVDAGAAQPAPPVSVSGTVSDISGAAMWAVPVRVFEAGGEEPIAETATDARGRFVVPLAPGTYRLAIVATAFTPFQQVIRVAPGIAPIDVVLDLDPIEVAVDVAPSQALVANPTTSLTATTLSGDELLDLPTDQEDLASHLMQLAGADETGDLEADLLASFVIDGFSDARLPHPDEIAQIIIDPNPMSADGGQPRIEIVTRPGTGQWRRSVSLDFADESLNARTPGELRKEPRQTRDANFRVEGPVIPDKLDMTFEASTRTDERAGDSLRAITPDADLFQGIVQPERRQDFEIEAEVQLNARHRLDVDFASSTRRRTNAGVGGFTLPERGSDERTGDWMFRVSERMFGADFNNNFRFQIEHDRSTAVPLADGFAIDVADAFESGGGTNRSHNEDLGLRLEDNLRWERGPWNFEWSGELRYERQRRVDQDNYNGTFEFASLHDYCLAAALVGGNCAETARIIGDARARGLTPVYLDARGREVEITGVPTTFTQAFGNADLELSELAFESHLQADRRFGEAASLRLGVGYEGTNHSRSFVRVNPVVNLQYRLTASTLLSGGVRLSFQDFGDYERLLRNDGSQYETELSISSPTFPDPFESGLFEVSEETASVWVLDPDYRSPYQISPQVSVTQEVPGDVRVTLSYSASRGVHQRRTRNINAPLPGTPLPDEILDLPRSERQAIVDRMRPFYPHVGNITQIESTGRSSGRTVRARVRPRGTLDLLGIQLSGNFNYTYRSVDDDNDFNNPYAREWGPSRRDHGVQSRFQIRMPEETGRSSRLLRTLAWATYQGARFNFSFRANTGRLYSIRSGLDLNGDQSSRDRPPGVSRNTEVGPANWNLDLTVTKDYRVGSQAADGGQAEGGRSRGRRAEGPRVRIRARINNLLNRSRPRGYGSVVTSPLFGLPTGYTGGRTVRLSMSLDF